MIANQDMSNPTSAVNQETDLTADFIRELCNSLGNFWRDDKSRRGFSTVEIIEAANLACLQSACLSVDLD